MPGGVCHRAVRTAILRTLEEFWEMARNWSKSHYRPGISTETVAGSRDLRRRKDKDSVSTSRSDVPMHLGFGVEVVRRVARDDTWHLSACSRSVSNAPVAVGSIRATMSITRTLLGMIPTASRALSVPLSAIRTGSGENNADPAHHGR
jgi:hypothetical protein